MIFAGAYCLDVVLCVPSLSSCMLYVTYYFHVPQVSEYVFTVSVRSQRVHFQACMYPSTVLRQTILGQDHQTHAHFKQALVQHIVHSSLSYLPVLVPEGCHTA